MNYIIKKPKTVQTKIDYRSELNEEQYRVVTNADGACLVLAGAGSGKTRTLVYRVAYLLERGVYPCNILLLTFTNKAAREMLERIRELVGFYPKDLWGGTFHHIANIILHRYGDRIGLGRSNFSEQEPQKIGASFTIIDEDDAHTLIRNIIKEEGFKTTYFPKPNVMKSIISFSVNAQIPLKEYITQRYSEIRPEIFNGMVRVFKKYQEIKQASGNLDFDDLLVYLLKLLEKDREVCTMLSQQFQYILVDEYQDTNRIQAKIIRLLSKTHRNIFVVGDDAQSIYSFRAANVGNILHFQQEYREAKIFRLETNYRSTPEILALATDSINNNTEQYRKSMRAYVKESKQKPVLLCLNDTRQEAEFVAQRILELRDENFDLSQIAVLFRSVFQSLELELELNRRKIPYIVRGGLRFFEQAHIKDIIAYLKVLANFHDELSWRRILLLEDGIGQIGAKKIIEYLRNYDSVYELMKAKKDLNVSHQVHCLLDRVFFLFDKIEKRKGLHLGEIISAIVSRGYRDYVVKTFDNSKDRLEDISYLQQFASTMSLNEFLSNVMLSEGFRGDIAHQADREVERLVLSTIHQAKGLEWKTVFVIGLSQGKFPHHRSIESLRELEEERRLFYVACTRAQQLLYLTYSRFNYSHQSSNFINRPSQFIQELDEDLYDRWEKEEDAVGGEQFDSVTGICMKKGSGILDTIARSRKKRRGNLEYVYE